MNPKSQDQKNTPENLDLFSLEYAVQLIILLAVGLLAFSFF
ncbi:hypothetical protein [Mucilaginibacter koreensis]